MSPYIQKEFQPFHEITKRYTLFLILCFELSQKLGGHLFSFLLGIYTVSSFAAWSINLKYVLSGCLQQKFLDPSLNIECTKTEVASLVWKMVQCDRITFQKYDFP